MFGWWEITDFWIYILGMHTWCMFSLWKRSVNLGLWVELQDLGLQNSQGNLQIKDDGSTKFRSTDQFHNLGQLNVDFRLLWAGKIGGPGQVCVWNPWLCLNHTGYALESSWVWIRPMAHDQAHQCWATCTVGSGPYEAKNHPKAGSLVGPTQPILAHWSPVISPHCHVWILPTSSSYDAMKLGVSIKAWGQPLIRHSFKAVRVMGPKKCVEFGHPRITWTIIGTSARDL